MLRHLGDIAHLHEQLSKFFDRQWLGIDLVHSTGYGLLNVLTLDMPCDGHYLGLLLSLDVLREEKLSNFLGCFVAIEERHIAVHKD